MLPGPAATRIFPTLSLRVFPVMLGPLPRRFADCLYLLLHLHHRPSPTMNGWACRFHPLKRLRSGGLFAGCSHFLMFKPHSLLATLVAPTTTVSRRAVSDVYIRAKRASLSARTGYASRPKQAIDGTGTFTPLDPQSCRLLLTVLSLPTPPKCFAASVLATLHAAFAREVRARPSGFSTFEALWVYLRYGPVTRSPSLLDGFVNRLQDSQSPSFLLFKLRGSNFYPDGTFTHC